jgi:tungstate transport system permease protein
METLWESFSRAFALILGMDGELIAIVLRSFAVSGAALAVASILGIPTGAVLGLKRFPLRGITISTLNAFMGLPPVVAGLFIYILLSRSGPFGFMGLLYSPTAMIIVQTILAYPIVAALSHSAVVGVGPDIRLAARTLGATRAQAAAAVVREARYGMLSAVIAGLGRVMAEVGAILIVGGNIAGYTRVMTTAIALETDKGDFSLALALGIVLLSISIAINVALHLVQKRGAPGNA